MEKYGRATQATDDNIIRRMHFACSITKATDTHSECVILISHGDNGYANAPQSYVVRTLPVLSDKGKSSEFEGVTAVAMEITVFLGVPP